MRELTLEHAALVSGGTGTNLGEYDVVIVVVGYHRPLVPYEPSVEENQIPTEALLGGGGSGGGISAEGDSDEKNEEEDEKNPEVKVTAQELIEELKNGEIKSLEELHKILSKMDSKEGNTFKQYVQSTEGDALATIAFIEGLDDKQLAKVLPHLKVLAKNAGALGTVIDAAQAGIALSDGRLTIEEQAQLFGTATGIGAAVAAAALTGGNPFASWLAGATVSAGVEFNYKNFASLLVMAVNNADKVPAAVQAVIKNMKEGIDNAVEQMPVDERTGRPDILEILTPPGAMPQPGNLPGVQSGDSSSSGTGRGQAFFIGQAERGPVPPGGDPDDYKIP